MRNNALSYMRSALIVILACLAVYGANEVKTLNDENIKLKEQINVASKKNGDLEKRLEDKSKQIEELTNKVSELEEKIN